MTAEEAENMSLGNNQFPADGMFPDEFDKLYGGVWLLENIAEDCGLVDDLDEAFGDSFRPLCQTCILPVHVKHDDVNIGKCTGLLQNVRNTPALAGTGTSQNGCMALEETIPIQHGVCLCVH